MTKESKMSKFGLGRGLADLEREKGTISEIAVLSGTERVIVRHIPIVSVGANPDQPRKTFNAMELNELADSIREKGVLQPILVRAVEGRAHQYEIIAGERRWRASKLAGLSEIPALVKTLDDNNAAEIALIENVQRSDLNAIEEAAAYDNLMQRAGYTHDDISRLIGKSVSYLRNILRLAGLPESVKQMLIDGKISATHARTLAVSENPEKLAHEIIAKNMSVKDTEEMVKKSKRSKKARSFSGISQNIPEIQTLENKIHKNTGFFTKIRIKRGGAGHVEIRFNSRPEMDEIIKMLNK